MAPDANGQSVQTRYTIDGNTLVQSVDHKGKDVAYPVTADPIWLVAFGARVALAYLARQWGYSATYATYLAARCMGSSMCRWIAIDQGIAKALSWIAGRV